MTIAGRDLRKAMLAVLTLLVLGACAATPPLQGGGGSAGDGGDAPALYHLASGDKLRVNVFGHPDVSGEFEVDGDGRITFPLLGPVQAAGRTLNELKQHIATELDEKYLVDPRVSVEVLNYRPFYILGQVEQPGSYPYQSGMTVRQAVALAGGYTRRAVTSWMTLIRPAEEGAVEMQVDQDTKVLPGDTIEVERRFF